MEAGGDALDPRLGSTLGGRWLLERKLGEGGMGAVYAARHVRNGKRAAIKILHAHSDRTGALFARFRREARIAALLERSGGVVEVFDDDVCDDGAPYIVMELLEGSNYEELAHAAGGVLPVGDVVAMADAVLLVLSEAHRRGVVHRDLKPANVFRTTDGRIKVLDFGIAALQAEADELGRPAPALTQPSTPMMGSIGFMPPEQARGEWESLDGRSDLWAVGATMFALLGGKTVHAATSARKELVRSMLEEPAPLASVAPHAPVELCHVVDRALAFARQKRWPDAGSMRAALLVVDGGDLDPLAATQEAPVPAAVHVPVATTSGEVTGVALGPGTTAAVASPAPPTRPRLAALLVLAASAVIVIVAIATVGAERGGAGPTPTSAALAAAPPASTSTSSATSTAPVVVTAEPVEPDVGASSAPASAPLAIRTARAPAAAAPPRRDPTAQEAPISSAPPPIIPLPPATSAPVQPAAAPDLDRRR